MTHTTLTPRNAQARRYCCLFHSPCPVHSADESDFVDLGDEVLDSGDHVVDLEIEDQGIIATPGMQQHVVRLCNWMVESMKKFPADEFLYSKDLFTAPTRTFYLYHEYLDTYFVPTQLPASPLPT